MNNPFAQFAPKENPFEKFKPKTNDKINPFNQHGEIEKIPADLPPLERNVTSTRPSTTGLPLPIDINAQEDETDYKKRVAKQYGIKLDPSEQDKMSLLDENNTVASEIEKLPTYLSYTKGDPEDMQRIVDKVFKGGAKLAYHEGYGDYVVKMANGDIIPFNKPGFTLEEARTPVQSLAAESVGGVAGMAGGPVAAAGGASIGAGVARMEQLRKGREFGFHDMSDAEILAQGAIEASWALGSQVALAGGGAIIRRLAGSPAAKKFLGQMTDEKIDEAVKKFEEFQKNIEARTGVKPEATTGQVISGVDPQTGRAIQSFEKGLESTGAEVGQKARTSQTEAANALKNKMFDGKPANDLSQASEVGEKIQDTAERAITRKQMAIEKDIFDEQAEAVTKQLDIVDVPPTAQTSDEIRDYITKARSDVLGKDGQLSKKYSEFWSQIPDVKADMSGVKQSGKKWSALLDSDIFKTLSKENRAIINDAVNAPQNATMDQVTRALSLLKSEQRTLSKVPAAAKTREMALLNDLVSEMQKARDGALKSVDPALKEQIYSLDAAYAIAKEKIDESLINRLITKKSGGGMRISDDKIMDAILRNPSEARNIAALISSPEYAGFGITSTFKNGAFGVYRDKVIDGTMTHKSFMNQYGPSLKEIFTPQEMRKFSSLEKASATIVLAEKREKALLDGVNRSFEMKLTGYEPEKILSAVSGSVSKTRKLMSLLRNEPDKLADYKALRARKLLNDLEGVDDLGDPTIDFKKIDNVLSGDTAELRLLYGSQFVRDMQMLKSITKLQLTPKQIQTEMTQLLKESPVATVPVTMWRAIIARPLSRMGLLTTGALKLDRGAARKATAKLLQNPKAMQDAMKLYRANAGIKKWIGLLNDIGAIELSRQIREETGE